MTVTLRPDQEQLVARVIESGACRDADEVIARALEMLQVEEEWIEDQRQEIAEKIERGIAQGRRGEVLTAEESIADMQRRKAEWMERQKR